SPDPDLTVGATDCRSSGPQDGPRPAFPRRAAGTRTRMRETRTLARAGVDDEFRLVHRTYGTYGTYGDKPWLFPIGSICLIGPIERAAAPRLRCAGRTARVTEPQRKAPLLGGARSLCHNVRRARGARCDRALRVREERRAGRKVGGNGGGPGGAVVPGRGYGAEGDAAGCGPGRAGETGHSDHSRGGAGQRDRGDLHRLRPGGRGALSQPVPVAAGQS